MNNNRREVRLFSATGRRFGLGHFGRSTVVNGRLQTDERLKVRQFVAHENSNQLREKIITNGATPLRIDGLSSAIKDPFKSPGLVLLDIPWNQLGQDVQEAIESARQEGNKVVGVDVPEKFLNCFDLVFQPNFSQGYRRKYPKVVSGWDCFLLPHRARRTNQEREGTLVIAVGGSDVANLVDSWVRPLMESPGWFRTVEVIRGPFTRNLPNENPEHVHVIDHRDAVDIPKILARASFGLCVYGISFFELLAAGIPTVTYSPYGPHHTAELREIESLGIALVAKSPEEAIDKLHELSRQPELATESGLKAAALLESPGEKRLHAEIVRLLELK